MKFSALKYTVKYTFCFIVGLSLYSVLKDLIPLSVNSYITSLFVSQEIPPDLVNFIYEIIMNSVDIFKILFIIMLSGITYIPNIFANLGIVLSGVFYSLSICICISDMVSSSLNSDHRFIVAVLILKILILSLLTIYSCVMSTKLSEDINSYKNSFLIMKSDIFVKYLLRILVILGCVIILEVTFRFIFNFLI